ncbi:hypothetical protein VNI00_018497 [Paramarasmius palmivorus]|uniref:JmjC domain-containing protein n=1 Tax=Paramarasmius palmivorus TaxID=297713 RepID=A0AAW0B0N2_9AGAR
MTEDPFFTLDPSAAPLLQEMPWSTSFITNTNDRLALLPDDLQGAAGGLLEAFTKAQENDVYRELLLGSQAFSPNMKRAGPFAATLFAFRFLDLACLVHSTDEELCVVQRLIGRSCFGGDTGKLKGLATLTTQSGWPKVIEDVHRLFHNRDDSVPISTLSDEELASGTRQQLVCAAFRQLSTLRKRSGDIVLQNHLYNLEAAAFYINWMLQGHWDLPIKTKDLLDRLKTAAEGLDLNNVDSVSADVSSYPDITKLRQPLFMALSVSPLMLLADISIMTCNISRLQLLRAWFHVGNVRPPVLRKVELCLWRELFSMARGLKSSTTALRSFLDESVPLLPDAFSERDFFMTGNGTSTAVPPGIAYDTANTTRNPDGGLEVANTMLHQFLLPFAQNVKDKDDQEAPCSAGSPSLPGLSAVPCLYPSSGCTCADLAHELSSNNHGPIDGTPTSLTPPPTTDASGDTDVDQDIGDLLDEIDADQVSSPLRSDNVRVHAESTDPRMSDQSPVSPVLADASETLADIINKASTVGATPIQTSAKADSKKRKAPFSTVDSVPAPPGGTTSRVLRPRKPVTVVTAIRSTATSLPATKRRRPLHREVNVAEAVTSVFNPATDKKRVRGEIHYIFSLHGRRLMYQPAMHAGSKDTHRAAVRDLESLLLRVNDSQRRRGLRDLSKRLTFSDNEGMTALAGSFRGTTTAGIRMLPRREFLQLDKAGSLPALLAEYSLYVPGSSARSVAVEALMLSMIGSCTALREAHDLSLRDDTADPNDEIVLASFNDFLSEASKGELGKSLNFLDVPASDSRHATLSIASNMYSHRYTSALPAYNWGNNQVPNGDLFWHLLANGNAYHTAHIDANGFGTELVVEAGIKLVFIGSSEEHDPFFMARIDAFSTFELDMSGPDSRDLGLLLMFPGDRFFMRPCTPHYVVTLEPALCHGAHFYSVPSMDRTVWALIHTFFREELITNTSHFVYHGIMERMMSHWHDVIVNNTSEYLRMCSPGSSTIDHVPNIATLEGISLLLSLIALTELGTLLVPNRHATGRIPQDIDDIYANARSLGGEIVETIGRHLNVTAAGVTYPFSSLARSCVIQMLVATVRIADSASHGIRSHSFRQFLFSDIARDPSLLSMVTSLLNRNDVLIDGVLKLTYDDCDSLRWSLLDAMSGVCTLVVDPDPRHVPANAPPASNLDVGVRETKRRRIKSKAYIDDE